LFLTAVVGETFLQDGPTFMEAIEGFYERLVASHGALAS
jgi:hypothetical protein